MKEVQIKDKVFEMSIDENVLQARIRIIANQINQQYAHKTPILLGILNGSFRLMSDLVKYLEIPLKVSFVKVASYHGTMQSSGNLVELIGAEESFSEKNVIIVEDIVDSGLTAERIIQSIQSQKPASLAFFTLLLKPQSLQKEIFLDYIGFEIPNDFVVGYGLDYDGLGRELNQIYKLKPSEKLQI